jgi:hypothetical protein
VSGTKDTLSESAVHARKPKNGLESTAFKPTKETIMDKSNLQIVWEILNASLYDLQCGVKEDAVNAIEEAIDLLEAEGVGE